MTWPIVVATGGPRERGRAYGQAARERVHGSIELYRAIFRHYTGLTWDQVRGRAGAFVEPIDALDVQLLPEMEGIAEGAAVDAEDVLALNVRTEVMYGLGAPGAAAAECTALGLAASRSAAGHVVVAENWDWKPRARDTCVLLVMVPPDRPGFATLVEAGLLAKSGMNEAGVGQVVNALVSSRDRGQAGAPFHAILRRTLTSRSLDEAVDAVRRPERASSANYLLGSAEDGIADVEAAPGGPDMVTVTTATSWSTPTTSSGGIGRSRICPCSTARIPPTASARSRRRSRARTRSRSVTSSRRSAGTPGRIGATAPCARTATRRWRPRPTTSRSPRSPWT